MQKIKKVKSMAKRRLHTTKTSNHLASIGPCRAKTHPNMATCNLCEARTSNTMLGVVIFGCISSVKLRAQCRA